MHSAVKFACEIATTNPDCALGMEIWLDDQQIFDQPHVVARTEFEHEFSDADAEHELRFVLKGKKPSDTTVDESGQIVKDATLLLTGIAFDDIKLGHMITELATYQHDLNGNGAMINDRFYGVLGCNGTVSLRFTTPLYLWLLENM